jgi:hypothetical protein
MSKYGNIRVVYNGIRFDSLAEQARYLQLVQMQEDLAISLLHCHPVYELQPAFTDNEGKRQAAIRYVADFEYKENGELIAEDVKGVVTPVFALKAKLFKRQYRHIKLRIIRV